MERKVSDSSFSSITKLSFEHGTLCECMHRRLDHRMLSDYVGPEEEAESSAERPEILCICGCVTFKLMTNLKYLEIKQKNSEAGTCP